MIKIEFAFHDNQGCYSPTEGSGNTLQEVVDAACDSFGRRSFDEVYEVSLLSVEIDGLPLSSTEIRSEIRGLPDLSDVAGLVEIVGRYRRALDIEDEAVALIMEERRKALIEERERRRNHPGIRRIS